MQLHQAGQVAVWSCVTDPQPLVEVVKGHALRLVQQLVLLTGYTCRHDTPAHQHTSSNSSNSGTRTITMQVRTQTWDMGRRTPGRQGTGVCGTAQAVCCWHRSHCLPRKENIYIYTHTHTHTHTHARARTHTHIACCRPAAASTRQERVKASITRDTTMGTRDTVTSAGSIHTAFARQHRHRGHKLALLLGRDRHFADAVTPSIRHKDLRTRPHHNVAWVFHVPCAVRTCGGVRKILSQRSC